MSFFSKKDRFKKRTLHFESLEHRELLSVSPLTYPGESTQGQYGSDFGTEADIPAPTIAEENITASTMTMTWNASTMTGLRASDGFTIEKLTVGSNGAETWTKVATVAYSYTIGNGTYSYEFTGLAALTKYTYRVSFGSTVLGTGHTERVTATTDKNEITAEPASSTSVKLSWNFAAKKDTKYEIWMSTNGGAFANTGKTVDTTGAAKAFSIEVKDLDPATEYTFKIKYYDLSSIVRETQEASCKTQYTLYLGGTTSTSVELYWEKAIGANTYQLQICTGKPTSDSDWTNASMDDEIVSGGSFDYDIYRKFKISDLKDNKTYYFRLRYVMAGETEPRYTDPLNFSTTSSLAIEKVTDTTAELKWTFSGQSGMAYYIQTKTGSADWSDHSGANTINKNYTLKNLEAGTTYDIRIRYTDGNGNTAYSASERITTGVSTTLDGVTDSSVTISWDIPNKSTESGKTNVNVQRCDGSLDPKVDSNWKTIATDVSDDSYESKYLGSDKKYYFRVTYTDTQGDEQHTLYVSARTNGTIEVSESSIDSVTLKWDFTPANKNYTVQMAVGETATGWGNVQVSEDNRALSGCTITGLTPNQRYHFRIVYTPQGESTTQTTTTATVALPDASLDATEVTASTVTLHWASTGFTGGTQDKNYLVYYYEGTDRAGTEDWILYETVPSSQTSCTVKGLMANVEYQFRIAYAGTAATAAQSSTLTVWTEGYDVNVTRVTMNSARLEWSFSTYEHAPTADDSEGGGGAFSIWKYIGTNAPPTGADCNNAALWQLIGKTKDSTSNSFGLDNNNDELEANTTYYYRISYAYMTDKPEEGTTGEQWLFPQATNYSKVVAVTTASDIKASTVYSTSLRLTWDTNGSSYTVQRRLAGTSTWGNNVTVTTNALDVTGLTADTEYEFQVTYNNGVGKTAILKVKTGKYIPSVVTKEIDIEYASATIQMTYTGAESGFQLMFRPKSSNENAPWTNANVTATTSTADKTVSMTITSAMEMLRPEQEYEFKIVYTANGNTIESEICTATISDDLNPSEVDSTSAVISWLASSFSDMRPGSNYTVQWRELGSTGDWKKGTGTTATTYKATGLDPNKEYEFRVMYSTVGGATAYSTIKTVTTTQPKATASTPQVGSVNLVWTFKSTDGFLIQYKDENGQWQTAATVSANSVGENGTTFSTLQHTGGNLDPEKEYTFRIAYKTSQSGSDYVYSEEVEVTTLGGMQVVDNSITTSTVTVKWDYVTDATYSISYRTVGSTTWAHTVSGIPGSTKEYKIEGLNPGTNYEIQLTYTDGVPKTVIISAKTTVTPPAAPTNISATDITTDSCTLKWSDNSAFEEYYMIEVINSVTGVTFLKEKLDPYVGSSSSPADYAFYALTGLDTNTKYTVTLYAGNAEGVSSTLTGTFTTTDVLRPNKVDKIAAATTPKSVTLSWKIKSVEDLPDPSVEADFRIEFEYTDPTTKVKNWFAVTNVTITYSTGSETWYALIVDKIEFGEDQSVTFENKTNYKFRVTVLGGTSGAIKYGDSVAVEKSAKTESITVPSNLSAANVTLTTATITFQDKDKTLDASEKNYTIRLVEGKYTDWTKVPADAVIEEFTVDKSTLANSKYSHALTGLKAGTTYSYVVVWKWGSDETIQSKPANFTTKGLPKATTIKTGYTLTSTGELASQISWKPPASTKAIPITSDMTITYVIEVSLTGKAGTFVTLTDSLPLSTSPKGLKYGAIAFSDLAKALPGGVDITAYKSLYIRVGATFTQKVANVDTLIGTAYSSNGKITLPKFS